MMIGMKRIRSDGDAEECLLCDTVMAVVGGLIGVALVAMAADLLIRRGRSADEADEGGDEDAE